MARDAARAVPDAPGPVGSPRRRLTPRDGRCAAAWAPQPLPAPPAGHARPGSAPSRARKPRAAAPSAPPASPRARPAARRETTRAAPARPAGTRTAAGCARTSLPIVGDESWRRCQQAPFQFGARVVIISTAMTSARFNFPPALGRFLRPEHRGGPFAYACARAANLKNAIEALGVPHTEVGAVRVNGEPATLHRLVR